MGLLKETKVAGKADGERGDEARRRLRANGVSESKIPSNRTRTLALREPSGRGRETLAFDIYHIDRDIPMYVYTERALARKRAKAQF